MEKIEKYMKQTLKNKVKITKAAIIAILITGGITVPKITRADTPNEKAVDIFKAVNLTNKTDELQKLVDKNQQVLDNNKYHYQDPNLKYCFDTLVRVAKDLIQNSNNYNIDDAKSEIYKVQAKLLDYGRKDISFPHPEIYRYTEDLVYACNNVISQRSLDKHTYKNQMDRLAKIVDRNSEKSNITNEHYYQYYITNENEKHGLELGDNSQARGKGSIVTSENGMAFGNGAVATGGDNTSREDIERKLKENQDKLNEIDNLKKTNATLTNQLSDLQQKEQDVIQAGIRVEQIRKAKANAEKEAEKLKNAWQTEVDGSKEFFKNYQAKIDDLNSRLTGVGKLKNNNIQTPEGLEKAVDEFKHNVEDGTKLNLSRDFYKDYITSYYKALGDLRLNKILYNSMGTNEVLPNGKKNTIKNIIDANFLNRDLKDIVIQYNDYDYNSSQESEYSTGYYKSNRDAPSCMYYSGNSSSGNSVYYNSLGEYSVDKNGIGRINGMRTGGYHYYNGKKIKTYKNIDVDLTNQEDYDLWKSVKDGWKAQIHDANKRSGSEFFGKFDTLTNGKSTILFNMATDMKFELVDLDYEITYDQWKYEQTHDTTWLDKKKECIDKRQQKLDTNEKILEDKYMELFGEKVDRSSNIFSKIVQKYQKEWKKENIDDFENKNKITTEKLTSELEQALGVNKNAIKERQEKLDRMKSEYEQAEKNAKGLNPSEKDLILSKEYERVKTEIEQMTNTLKENQTKLKALKEALTLYDLKNNGKDNIAYGTDTLAVGDNAIAFGKGTKTVGENSISFGVDLLTLGENNTNIGQLSQVNGEKNQVMGFSNEVKGDQNLVIGNNNRVISNGGVGVNPHPTSDTHGKTMGTLLSTPTLEVTDRDIVMGEHLDLNSLIYSAHDDKDGDLKDQVKVISVVNTQDGKKYEFDNNNFVGNVVGTYKVTYEVKNKYGATIHKTNTINVKQLPNNGQGGWFELPHTTDEPTHGESATKTHAVTFIGIDGNKETVTVNDGDSLESTHLVGKYSSYEKPGYVFDGFDLAGGWGNRKITTKTPIHSDITVYTVWKSIPTEPTLEPGATPSPEPQPDPNPIITDKSALDSEVSDDATVKIRSSYMLASKELQQLYDDVMEEAKAVLNDPNGDISHLSKLKQLSDRLRAMKPNRSDDDVENNMLDNANNVIERKIDQLIKLSEDVIGQANRLGTHADRSTTRSSRVRRRRSVDANPSESTPKAMTPIVNENVLHGNRNEVFGNGNLVFGSENKVGTETKGVMNNILFGNKIDATNVNNAIVFGNESKPIEGAVSFGNDTTTRQLKFVAKGTDDTDAVNFSQLKDYVKKNAKGKTVNIKNELLSKLNYDPDTYLKIDETYLQYIVDEKGNIKIPDTKKLSLNIDGVKDALGKDSDIANPKDKFVTDKKVHDYVTENFVSKDSLDVTKLLKSSDVDVTGDEYINVSKDKNKYGLSLNKDKLGANIDLSNNSAITNINTELGKKANLDASNIKGTYLTNWQSTLGTGKIEDNDKGLVNGGVVKTYVDDQIKNNLGTINTSLSSKLSDITISGDKYITANKVNNSKYTLTLNEDALNTHLNSYDFKDNTTIQNMNKNMDDINDMKANKDASNIDPQEWIATLGLGHVTPTEQKLVTGAGVHNFVTGVLNETVEKIDTKLDKKLDKDGLEVKGDTKYITVTPSDDNNKKIYTVKFDDSKLTETIKGSDFSNNTSIKDMLDKKANLDASNLEDTNITKWQNKLGNGTIDANSTGLVTGQTIFNYVNPINEKVNTLETSLTDKLSDITINGDTYIKTEKASKGVYNLSLNKDTLESLINSKTADLAKNDTITNINKELDKKANKDASNLDDKDVENWQNKLGNGTVTDGDTKLVKGGTVFTYVNNSINTIKQELSNKATEDLAKKLDIDANNLNDTGVTNLTTKLGTGAIEDDNKNLVTGGTVKKYVTEELNTINNTVSGKLSSSDVDVKGDDYITVNTVLNKPNHYKLTFDKDKLATDLDLTKNTKLNEQFNKYALLDGTNLDSINLNVWQAKLGNGTITKDNTGLVKGGDIFNYVNNIKQELNNQATQDLSNKLDKNGSNLDKDSLDKLTNKLSEGSNLTTPTNRLVTDTKVSEALKGKLNVDVDNLSDKGVTNLTDKLGKGTVTENNTGLITGGKVYEVKKELDNKYTTLNNQVTTNTKDISKLKTDVEDLKNTKQDITKINNRLGDIDNSITNINTKLDGKLDKTDLSIKGDNYIKVDKDTKFNYTLSLNKDTLAKDLDLTNNNSINNMFTTKLGDINTNIGDLTTKVENNTNSINSLTNKVDTNTKDIDTLKQNMTKKLNVDADNLTTKGETNLINKLSKGSDISKPNNKLVTDTQVNTFLNDKFKNFSSIDNKVINTLQQGITVVNNKADLALAKSDLALNGISNAVAMANLPQVASYGKYKHMLTAAYGNYAGVNALALGLSGTTDSRRITYKISGAVNTKGNIAFGTGIGVMLGEIHDGNVDTPSHVKEQLIKSEKERQLMRTALINQQNKAKQQEDQIKDLYRIIGELQNQLKKNK